MSEKIKASWGDVLISPNDTNYCQGCGEQSVPMASIPSDDPFCSATVCVGCLRTIANQVEAFATKPPQEKPTVAEEWDLFCADCKEWCLITEPSQFELYFASRFKNHDFMVKHRLHHLVETTLEAARRNGIKR